MNLPRTAEDSAAADLLARAAGVLDGTAADAQGEAVLARLGYQVERGPARGQAARLLRAAAGFHRLFNLSAREAPGMVAMGGEIAPGGPDAVLLGVSGTGLSLREAFESCIGEGVELISQFTTPGDVVRVPGGAAAAGADPAMAVLWAELRPPGDAASDWIAARRLGDGAEVLVPADLCWRRPAVLRNLTPPWPLSTGCAAGATPEAAMLHAVLELIERDAAAQWWLGARRPRLIAAGSAAAALAAETLAALRGGAGLRRSWLLDITADTAVPCVAAVSCTEGDRGVAIGLAARPSLALAARAALLELCQMELAQQVVAAKQRERGEAALNAADWRHLRRGRDIDAATCITLQPLAPPLHAADLPETGPGETVTAIVARLADLGLVPCAVDLTSPHFGIPVFRVVCPGLQPHPEAPIVARLRAALAATTAAPGAAAPAPLY